MEDQTVMTSGWSQAKLVVRQGAQTGTSFPLPPHAIEIGRDETADISLQDPEMSRRHVRISWQGGRYILEDLNSTNGTLLNDTRVTAAQRLSPGDKIRMGQCVLEFQAHAEPVPAQPAAGPAEVAPPPAPTPAPTTAEEEPQKGGSRCLLWGCGCLVLLAVLVVIVAIAALFTFPDDLQRILDENGIPIQLTMLYLAGWLA
jgi:hypothetical protein